MILNYYQMRIYMTKKGQGEVVQLTLYEADNSDIMSSRSVIYYNSNSINIIIVIVLTQ